jgi:hypothetical protein
VLKDNVVWSSTEARTEAGFPLCAFRSFGTHRHRSDGTIDIGLTSSAKDEARVFKSSADLKASLLATLDAHAAAIARTKASIMNGGMHPEAAFALTSAPEAMVVPAAAGSPAATLGTQEAQASPTSTPSAAESPKGKVIARAVFVCLNPTVQVPGGGD